MSLNKLVFFDVDGTLLNDRKVIQESTIETIEQLKNKGFIFCIATGRTLTDGIIEISKVAKLNGFLVLANGNFVWDIKNETLTTLGLPLDKKIVYHFYETCKKFKRQLNISFIDGTSSCYYFGDDINAITDPKFYMFGPTIYKFNPVDQIENDLEKQIVHISIKAEQEIIKEISEEFVQYERNHQAQISNVSDVYIEADTYGISKWTGCQFVQNKLDIANENTYAFGDSENDLILLSNVGNPVCMGNATEKMKNMYSVVIGDNNSDAISNFLLDLVK